MSTSLVGALALATAAAALVMALAVAGDVPPPRISFPHPDAAALADAGRPGAIRRWEATRALIAACALAVAWTLGLPIAFAALAAVAPSAWIRLRAEAARDRARRALPRMLTTTEAALRSGVSLPEALRRAADASGDRLASRRLAAALHAFDLGAGLDAALVSAARASRDDRTNLALGTLALGIAERLPRERLADLVALIADRTAFEERLGDEVRARAAGARQQQRLLALLVPAIASYLALTVPTLAATLGSDLGRFVLIPAAVVLEASGVLLGRRVIREALR